MESKTDSQEIVTRIKKDIDSFYINLENINIKHKGNAKVVDAAKNYAKDAQSYLSKDDLYTAFACISYAHGLLDALKELAKE